MIRYLVKFVNKESYADDLLSGKLFMHCGKYYHNLEKKNGIGQGDIREGSLFPNTAVYKGIYFPIYCMYMIKDEDIHSEKVVIDKKILKDFGSNTGYMVIVSYDDFVQVLPTVDTGGYRMDGFEVQYGIPSNDVVKKMMCDNDYLNLKVKNPYFEYQKEYRLLIYKSMYQAESSDSIKGEDHFICNLKDPIIGFAKKLPLSILKETNEGFELDFNII